MAAAVRLPPPREDLLLALEGVRDSKQLPPAKRAKLYEVVLRCAIDVGIGVVSAATIDRVGLARAGQMAMQWAVEDMAEPPDCLLLDAFTLRGCSLHQRAIVRGDAHSLSIAAASIVAKVSRDKLMRAADALFPGYGFRENKGYGTESHRRALHAMGPCAFHRLSYQPLRLRLETLL